MSQDAEKCECDLSQVIPMSQWLEEEQEDECRPCAIAILIKDYQKELDDAGRQDLAEGFTTIADSDDPVKAASDFMDKIKESVDGELKNNLLMLDCMAQTSQQNIEGGS